MMLTLGMADNNIIDKIKESAGKKILYFSHAIRQMIRPDRMISPEEVRYVVEYGEIIERGYKHEVYSLPRKHG